MTVEHLWEAYWVERSDECRAKLISEYIPLVHTVTGKIHRKLPKNVGVENLFASGILGLVNAIKAFDPSKGARFQTYASYRIRGKIIDDMRDWDWVSRQSRNYEKKFNKALNALQHETGETPSVDAVADRSGLSPKVAYRTQNESAESIPLSIHDLIDFGNNGEGVTRIEMIADRSNVDLHEAVEQKQLKVFLIQSVSRLPEQQRIVVGLNYFDGMNLKEISVEMKMSESRISQIRAKAMLALTKTIKQRFGDYRYH